MAYRFQTGPGPQKRVFRRLAVLLLGIGAGASALADSTALTVTGATRGTSDGPVTMQFPVTRSGDLGYDAILDFHTVDGSAIAGTDYTAAAGRIVIPAAGTSATIPVTLGADTGSGPSLAFQLRLDGAVGIGPVPGFAAQQLFATGSSPASVTSADVNGDGRADLIVANYGDSSISVFLNTTAPGAATPSFSAQPPFACVAGANPYSVATADINGDGKPDLVVANFSDTVSVLLNTTVPGAATSSFASQQPFTTGTNSTSVAAADVNGDGKPDLIVANILENTVSVLLNTTTAGAATPGFATQQAFATDAGPASVTTADVNGDGKPDLIVANIYDTVSVLLNATPAGAATAVFATQQPFPAGRTPNSVAAADVNGDGRPDLVVANFDDNTVSVLLNSMAPGAGAPVFATQRAFATGTGAVSVTTADANGDGKPDLVVANFDGTVSVLRNTTAPGAATADFGAQHVLATGATPYAVAAADIDGNGKPDLIVANFDDDTISVLTNTTTPGAATPNFAGPQVFAAGASPASVAAADVNGDGKSDLVIANYADTTVAVLLGTTAPGAATPGFAAPQPFATAAGTSPYSVATSDINGDGKPDLVVANFSDTISVLLNTTAPGAAPPSFGAQQAFATGTNSASVTAAEINGDGKPDLVVANLLNASISVLFNTTAAGATTASFAPQQAFATGSGPASVAAADVNGDGRLDLIVANSNNTISVLLNTTAPGAVIPGFAVQQTFAAGTTPASVAAVDVNGDGRPDLVVANFDDSTVSVLLNTTVPGATTPAFAAQQAFATGAGPDSVTTADVNGDGKPDLIVSNFHDDTATVLLNTTTPGATSVGFAALPPLATGGTPYSVATTDVNGDGMPDLMVANNADNTVSVLLNTQYRALIAGNAATGTIVHDYVLASGFD